MADYIQADLWRRAVAWLLNSFALTFLLHPLQWIGINDSASFAIIQVGCIFFCSYYYWSPGKHLMQLKVLRSDGGELPLKERLLRNSPFMMLFVITIIPAQIYAREPGEEFVADPFQLLVFLPILGILIFNLCNMATPFFDKRDRTLLDMKLESFVGMHPRPLKLKPVKMK